MKGFVKLKLYDGVSKLLVDIDSVRSVESSGIVHSLLTLKNGETYKLWDNVDNVTEALNRAICD